MICRYRKTFIPYAPVKEEIVNWDPKISLLHDVITDEQANQFINHAIPEVSTVFKWVDGEDVILVVQTSHDIFYSVLVDKSEGGRSKG